MKLLISSFKRNLNYSRDSSDKSAVPVDVLTLWFLYVSTCSIIYERLIGFLVVFLFFYLIAFIQNISDPNLFLIINLSINHYLIHTVSKEREKY